MQPQFIEQAGKPAFVVLTIEDYNALISDKVSDEEFMRQAQESDDGARIPHDVLNRIIAGENPIKVVREWKDITQDDLALEGGLSKNFISMLETGRRALTTKTAIKLALALEVNADLLID